MNNISLVRDVNIVKTGEYDTEFTIDKKVTIEGEAVLHNYNLASNLDILLENSSSLTFYQVKEVTEDLHIEFTLKELARLNYKLLLLNRGHNKVVVDVLMPYDNAFASVVIRAINLEDNSNLDVVINGKILEKTKNNELIEDLKGLIIHDNDTIKISPNMMAHTSEVLANHFVTIGSYNKDELFYLMMRGLSLDAAKKLLKQAFLTNIMSTYEKEKMEVKIDE